MPQVCNHKIYIFQLLLLSITNLHAQLLPNLKFTHLTTANGLSTDYVRNILQDSKGLMWICTTNGLNRYDGNSFKIYKHLQGDTNSLPSNDIWVIKEDKKGNFWVGTQAGLCYFEPSKNRCTNYVHNPKNSNSLVYFRAENLVVDEEDNVWVGSLNGLQKFNTTTKQFQLIQFATKKELALNVNAQSVYYMYQDHKNQLWVQAGGNLFLINKQLVSYTKMVDKKLYRFGVTSIYQDNEEQYWLSFWGGGFSKYDGINAPAQKDFIIKKGIYFRMGNWKDVNKNNWLVVSNDDGVFFYNKKENITQYFQNDITNLNSFAAHEAGEILNDNKNNLWITTSKGLEMIEPSSQFFFYHYLGEIKDRQNYRNYGIAFPLCKEHNNFWVGLWHAHGVIILDSNWKQKKQYTSFPEKSITQDAKSIYDVYKENGNIYWITTDEGLVKFNKTKNNSLLYKPTDTKVESFECRKILPLGSKYLFVRTRHNGLYIFNKKTLLFKQHFTTSNSELPHNDVNSIAYDKNGNLWIATADGICKLDTTSLTITKVYKKTTNNLNSLVDNFCRSMEIDAYNNLWIGTSKGLSKFSLNNKIFANYTTANGLCNDAIFSLIVDKNNNVWMNTQNGVSIFKQQENKFINFYKEDGLPQNSLEGKLFKDEYGTVYLTDAGIIITVNPNNIPQNNTKPAVIITDASVNNLHYNIELNRDKEKFINTNFKNSNVVINFAVLNYNAPKLNSYFYKLEGIDDVWHKSDRGIAAYISIPPGKYLLRVKGSNNNGVMNEEGDFIKIIIIPEWYQSVLFKMLSLLIIIGITTFFVRMRITTVRKESLLKQQIIETEMQALRAQMNPHFIFNSLNSIENFMMKNEKRLASDYLHKFSNLIRSILDSSLNDLVPLSKDMEALKLYIDLEQLRFNNKFIYTTNIDYNVLNEDYKVPSLIIQPFVENAIIHGFAHSDKLNLQLNITVVLENNYIKYSIRDNGIGQKKATEYNFQNKPNHKSVGFTITKNRIDNFNNPATINNAITITDIFDEKNQANGTLVEIKLKVI